MQTKQTTDPLAGHRKYLEPHERRTIRAFLNCATIIEGCAFFDLLYAGIPVVEHDTARRVEAELATCRHKVGEVFTGWRPRALS